MGHHERFRAVGSKRKIAEDLGYDPDSLSKKQLAETRRAQRRELDIKVPIILSETSPSYSGRGRGSYRL